MDADSDSAPSSSALDFAVIPPSGATIDEVMTPRLHEVDSRARERDDVYTYVANPESERGGLVVPVNVSVQNVRDMLDATVTVDQDLEYKLHAVGWPKLTVEASQTVDPAELTHHKSESQEHCYHHSHRHTRLSARRDSFDGPSQPASTVSRAADLPSSSDDAMPSSSRHPYAEQPRPGFSARRYSAPSEAGDDAYLPSRAVAPRDVFPPYPGSGYAAGDDSSDDQSASRPGPSQKTLFVGHRKHTREVRPRGRASSRHTSGAPRPYKCRYVDPVTGDECATGGCVKVYDLLRHLITLHAKDELAHVEGGRLVHRPDGERMGPDDTPAQLLRSVVNLAYNRALDQDWAYMRQVGVTKTFDCAAAVRKNLRGLATYLRCWAKKQPGVDCGAVFPRDDTLSKHLREQHNLKRKDNEALRPAHESPTDLRKLELIYGKRFMEIERKSAGLASSAFTDTALHNVDEPMQEDEESRSELELVAGPSSSYQRAPSHRRQSSASSAPVIFATPPAAPTRSLTADLSPSPSLQTSALVPSTEPIKPRSFLTPEHGSVSLPRARGPPRRLPSFKLPLSPAQRAPPGLHPHIELSTTSNPSPRSGLLFLPSSPLLPRSPLHLHADLSPALSTPASLMSTLPFETPSSSYSPSPVYHTIPLSAQPGSPCPPGFSMLFQTDSDLQNPTHTPAPDSNQHAQTSPWDLMQHMANHPAPLPTGAHTPSSLAGWNLASPLVSSPLIVVGGLPFTPELSPEYPVGDLHDIPVPGAYVPDVYTAPGVAHPEAGAFSGATYRQMVGLHDALCDPSSSEYARLSEQVFTRARRSAGEDRAAFNAELARVDEGEDEVLQSLMNF